MALSDDLKKDLQKAVTAVGGYVAARESEIAELIERTAGKVDERTERRYSGAIDKVRAGLQTGVARLADQQGDEVPGEAHGTGDPTGDPAPQDPARPEGPPTS